MPVVKARNVLRAWRYGGSDNASEICNRADVGLDAPVVAMLLQEFEDRGLIGTEVYERGSERWGLTEAGIAFVTASGKGRTPKARAQAALDALLARCAEVNADPANPYHVDQVWLFGSMIRDVPDVGDIDLVVLNKWSPAYEAISDLADRGDKARRYAAERLPEGVLRDSINYFAAAHLLFDRQVLGSPRNALLSPNAASDFLMLACPCRLAFDAELGGRVDGPVLDKHPDAGTRHPDVRDPPVMPDLTPPSGPMRPVSVEYAYAVEVTFGKNQDHGLFEPGGAGFRKVVQARELAAGRLVASAAEVEDHYLTGPATLALRRAGDLDGRSVAGLLAPLPRAYERSEAAAAITVRRSIDEGPDGIADELAIREVKVADLGMTGRACTLLPVLLLAAADIVRIARRDEEAGRERPIQVSLLTQGRFQAEHDVLLRTALERPSAWLGAGSADVIERLRVTVNGRDATLGAEPEDEIQVLGPGAR